MTTAFRLGVHLLEVDTSIAGPLLITNPADDSEFGRVAHALLADGRSPSDLERALRERYPAAVVHPRVLSGERSAVWYVYREGKWLPSGSR